MQRSNDHSAASGGATAAKACDSGADTPVLIETAKTTDGTFKLPELAYRFSELEPHIDERTMRFHYFKHFNGYRMKLNAAASSSNLSEIQRTAIRSGNVEVRNNGGTCSSTGPKPQVLHDVNHPCDSHSRLPHNFQMQADFTTTAFFLRHSAAPHRPALLPGRSRLRFVETSTRSSNSKYHCQWQHRGVLGAGGFG